MVGISPVNKALLINEPLISKLSPGIRNYRRIVALCGGSTAGKSVLKALLKADYEDRLVEIILDVHKPRPRLLSADTALPHPEEIEYRYHQKRCLDNMWSSGAGLIYRLKENGNVYFLSSEEIETKFKHAVANGKIVLIISGRTIIEAYKAIFPNLTKIMIDASNFNLWQRLSQRDNLADTKSSIKRIINTEINRSIEFRLKRKKFDFVIENNNEYLPETTLQLQKIIDNLLSS